MATTEAKPAPKRAPRDDKSGAGPDTPVKPKKADPAPVEYVILHAQADSVPLAWRVDGTFTAPGRTRKSDVLDDYVGTDDAKPGLWKAVRASEWAGGISVAEPVMVPKVHREPLKD